MLRKTACCKANHVRILKYASINLFVDFRANILGVFRILDYVNEFCRCIPLKFFSPKLNESAPLGT